MADRLFQGRGLALTAALVALPLAAAAAVAPVAALAAIAVLAVLGLVTLNSYGLLLVVMATFPWDDMLGYPSSTFSVTKILGGLLLFGFAFQALAGGERLRGAVNLLPLAVFEGLVLVSLLVCAQPSEGLIKTLRYVLFGVFTVTFVQLVRDRGQLHRVISVLGVSAIAASALGLANFLTGAETRASGPIGEANDFAYLLSSTLPLVIYLALRSEGRRRRLWWAGVALILLTTAATLSRGALVGLGVLAAWALLTRRVRVGGALASLTAMAILAGGAFALYGPLINERLTLKGDIAAANVASRKALWSAAINMGADHPVIGVGPGRFGIESENYITDDPINIDRPFAHNSYLEIFAETGFPGLVAFLLMLGSSWMLARRSRYRALAAGDAQMALLASAIQGGLVVAVTAANFLSVQITAPLWILSGLAAVVSLMPLGERQPAAGA
jgi:putative inorganic carbon (HCO3(-)) transporter